MTAYTMHGKGHGKTKKGRLGKRLAGLALFFLIWTMGQSDTARERTPMSEAFKQELAEGLAETLYDCFLPGAILSPDAGYGEWMMYTQVETILPLYGMAGRESGQERIVWEDDGHSRTVTYEEITGEGDTGSPVPQEAKAWEDSGADQTGGGYNGGGYSGTYPAAGESEEDLWALLQEENRAALKAAAAFVPHEQRMQVDLEELANYEILVKTFYTIDANTMAGTGQLNVEALTGRDMTLTEKGDGPQILIYHTHSQEAFADSIPGDESATIVGVGDHLAEILRDRYGYNVLHHKGQYDADTRDDAYGKALPALEEILAENPSIQVVIDLHRDEMPEETRLVMDLDGRPTARFMFFNGLSRTRKSGDIDYLQNDNVAGNLAFSFQMKLKCEEYYPGLTRKIYLKGYRYNLHLKERSLLVELGAQNNTVEEAMNACDPLAHALHMVLSGE
ncbi:MAG: stage II sporulation protein P [Clostridium sp.]|nr:stage II sporulation protein P [Acetatifactor muris]MCM1526056.1 stage II sporulation protein P [Bacteroides sp.]MCM1562184.1 stage II sporulation protein P [Clostridium sp.]